MTPNSYSRLIWLFLFLCLPALAPAETQRGTVLHESSVYLTPDLSSAKLVQLDRGFELIILETTHGWVHVECLIESPNRDEETPPRTVTGWVEDKFFVGQATANGDQILFGEAIDSEDEAEKSHGRHGAAQDAIRLYYRVADIFPSSLVAAQSMYRSADIRWQIDRADVMTRPSAKEKEAFLRGQIEEKYMREVIKKFPGTKWADLAAFHLIDNKLCGDWQGDPKCPEKEAEIYEKFAADHSQSPVAAQALYQAAARQAALIEMYKSEDHANKSDQAKTHALSLAQKVTTAFPQTDWAARAFRLKYMIEQGVPTYGD